MNFNALKNKANPSIFTKALILTMVIFISYFSGTGINMVLKLSDNYLSGIWCAVSAIVVFDDLPENAKKLMKDRLLGTFVGALFTASTLFLSGNLLLSIAISLFLTCISIIFFKWDGALKIGCITVLIVGITSHGSYVNEIWQSGLMRFLESVAGGLISLFATIIIDKAKKRYLADAPHSKKMDNSN
ncbi:FUSC family protein [Pedobacter suwonensis]|uniref:FUSC family protein n=1 Tax=Pedobacter suwonensis TaxID=332999 RepID=UPI003681B288